MPLLTKSVALGLGLAFVPAANCLQVDSGNKYTRQGSEMMAWDGDDGEEESQSRVAVLVTGSVESLALTPLLGNVVQANARKGLQVDLYFALRGRSSPGETTNPKMVTVGAPSGVFGCSRRLLVGYSQDPRMVRRRLVR